ncbi:MAG: Flp family type IVb pilin [Pseudomonadota bacterium]
MEYGMIAAVLSLAIVGGVGEVQSQIMLEWTDINSTTNQALNKN